MSEHKIRKGKRKKAQTGKTQTIKTMALVCFCEVSVLSVLFGFHLLELADERAEMK